MIDNLDQMLQELRALGVRITRVAGILGQVPDTFRMHESGEWSPELHRQVAELLKRAGFDELREGLWGEPGTTDQTVERWEELARDDATASESNSQEGDTNH